MRLSRVVIMVAWLTSPAALARPWNGVTPGVSTSADVIEKFGEPTRTLTENGRSTLIYARDAAIKGTQQAQFKVNANDVVERIDVYPAVSLDAKAIEKSYGGLCTGAQEVNCYVLKQTPTHHAYFVYARMGLAVFFTDDGVTVRSMSFLAPTSS